MRKVFITNLVLLLGLNLLIKPFYIFAIDRGVQNAVGAEEYGLYFALFNFSYLFQIVHDLGIQNFNLVHFSKTPQQQKKYLPKILGSKIVFAVLYFGAVLAMALLLGYEKPILPLLGLITLNHVLASLAVLMRTSLSAQGFYRLDSLLSVIDKLIMIGVVGVLLWGHARAEDFQIEWFVYAQTISFAATALFGIVLLIAKIGFRPLRIRFDRIFNHWLLRRSLPFALVLLLMTLYTRMDAVMLERMLTDGAYQSGIYAASYRILDAANMAGVLFAGLLIPMFSKLLGNPGQLAVLVQVSFRMLWIIAVTVTAVSWAFAQEIIELLYPAADAEWWKVFPVLMTTYLFTSAAYIYGTLLTSAEKLAPMNKVFLFGVLLNFTLNLALIPNHGAWGSALATVVTQGLVASFLVVLCIRLIPLPRHGRKLALPFLFGLAAVALSWGCTFLPFGWMWQLIILCSILLILSLIIRLFPLQSFKEIFLRVPPKTRSRAQPKFP